MISKKQRIFNIIEIGNRGDFPSRFFDYFITVVIFINIAVLFIDTFDDFQEYHPIINAIEMITIIIFIIEYLLRIYTADLLYPKLSYPKAILRFIFSIYGIIDLLTILPFFFLSGFAALRILRVIRIFRLFKINNTYDSFNVITSVFRKKKDQILSSVIIILMLMLVSALCIYSAEHDAQPEVFANAFNGIWWCLSTIFTVGYGDMYPITVMGRAMTVVITFLGVGAVAIPTGIISAGFVEHYQEVANAQKHHSDTEHTVLESVGHHSPFINMTIKEVERKYDYYVVAIQRDGEIHMPGSTTQIHEGDTLIAHRRS